MTGRQTCARNGFLVALTFRTRAENSKIAASGRGNRRFFVKNYFLNPKPWLGEFTQVRDWFACQLLANLRNRILTGTSDGSCRPWFLRGRGDVCVCTCAFFARRTPKKLKSIAAELATTTTTRWRSERVAVRNPVTPRNTIFYSQRITPKWVSKCEIRCHDNFFMDNILEKKKKKIQRFQNETLWSVRRPLQRNDYVFTEFQRPTLTRKKCLK